jgi:hypothetical protein
VSQRDMDKRGHMPLVHYDKRQTSFVLFLHSQYPQVFAAVIIATDTFIIALLCTAKSECLGGSVTNLLIDLQHLFYLLGMPCRWKRHINFATIPIVQCRCFCFFDSRRWILLWYTLVAHAISAAARWDDRCTVDVSNGDDGFQWMIF